MPLLWPSAVSTPLSTGKTSLCQKGGLASWSQLRWPWLDLPNLMNLHKALGLLLGCATPKGQLQPSRTVGPCTGSDCACVLQGGTCWEGTTDHCSLSLIPLDPPKKTGGLWRSAGFGSTGPCAASSNPSSSNFLGCSFCRPLRAHPWEKTTELTITSENKTGWDPGNFGKYRGHSCVVPRALIPFLQKHSKGSRVFFFGLPKSHILKLEILVSILARPPEPMTQIWQEARSGYKWGHFKISPGKLEVWRKRLNVLRQKTNHPTNCFITCLKVRIKYSVRNLILSLLLAGEWHVSCLPACILTHAYSFLRSPVESAHELQSHRAEAMSLRQALHLESSAVL